MQTHPRYGAENKATSQSFDVHSEIVVYDERLFSLPMNGMSRVS
jgi:hypothetical protein